MTEISEALEWHLKNHGPLVQLVGNAVYPDVAEKLDDRFIVYQKLDRGRVQVASGPAGSAAPRFEVTAWALSRKDADAVAAAIHGTTADPCLDGFGPGWWGPGPDGGMWIAFSRVENAEDVTAELGDGDDRPLYGCRLEIQVMHNEV